jgi:hypothetical protein
MAKPGSIAVHYKRLRARYFLAVLALAISAALFCHRLFGFDPDWGVTNLALSIEASVAMSLFMMLADEQEAAQRKQLEYLLHLMEAQHALLRAAAEKGE